MDSRVEALLSAIIENNPELARDPESRIESDLTAIIKKDPSLLKTPESPIEYLLVQLYDKIDSGGGGAGQYDVESIDNGDGTQTLKINEAPGAIEDGLVFFNRMNDELNRPTEVKIYGKIIRPSMLASTSGNGYMYYRVSKITFADEITAIKNNAFYQCGCETPFKDFVIPSSVTEIGANAFRSSGIVNAEFPETVTVLKSWVFCDANSLETVKMPGITSMPGTSVSNSAITGTLSHLKYVECGKIGKTVTSCAPLSVNCKKTGLEIVIYSNGTYLDTVLANIRNGATNAKIVIKASEDTTYNGTAYSAGDTILTSEVSE